MSKSILSAALVLAMFVAAGCAAFMSVTQSPYFSKFSLRELVEKNKPSYGLICSAGGIGGGGGGSGGGSVTGRKQFHHHKGESFSCQIQTSEQFNEAGFISSLKENTETDIKASGAKIIENGSPDANSFYFQYVVGDIEGRTGISVRRTGNDYYSLKADLDEKNREETKRPQ